MSDSHFQTQLKHRAESAQGAASPSRAMRLRRALGLILLGAAFAAGVALYLDSMGDWADRASTVAKFSSKSGTTPTEPAPASARGPVDEVTRSGKPALPPPAPPYESLTKHEFSAAIGSLEDLRWATESSHFNPNRRALTEFERAALQERLRPLREQHDRANSELTGATVQWAKERYREGTLKERLALPRPGGVNFRHVLAEIDRQDYDVCLSPTITPELTERIRATDTVAKELHDTTMQFFSELTENHK